MYVRIMSYGIAFSVGNVRMNSINRIRIKHLREICRNGIKLFNFSTKSMWLYRDWGIYSWANKLSHTLCRRPKWQNAYRLTSRGAHYFVYSTKKNKSRRTLKLRDGFAQPATIRCTDFVSSIQWCRFPWILVTSNPRIHLHATSWIL